MPSPLIYEYRNKVEFTAGYRHVLDEGADCGEEEGENGNAENENGDKAAANEEKAPKIKKIPAAGFLASGWSGGVTPPHLLQNCPDWACSIADILNAYLPTCPMPPYDSKVHRGFFRSFTVRCSLRTKECMVIVVHAPAKGGVGAKEDEDDFSEAFESEKAKLVEMLTKDILGVPEREFPEGYVRPEVDGEGVRVTSVFFQEYEGLSQPGPDHPVQVSVV